jgi:hypothetical protein
MNIRAAAFAAIMAFGLVGCGTLNNRNSVANVPASEFDSASKGVVIVSTGAPEHCISTATFLSLYTLPKQERLDGLISVDGYAVKSDFTDHHGYVNGIALPAGKYAFVPSIANPYVSTVRTTTFQFEVAAGETTYLGELFMPRACSLNNSFVVRDQSGRDIELAEQKNPSLKGRPIVKRLMQPVNP